MIIILGIYAMKFVAAFALFELWNTMLESGFTFMGVVASIFLFLFALWPVKI